MYRRLVVFLILVLALASFIGASCTVSLDKSSYIAGETATAQMSCSTNPEKNTPYTLNWTYQNGTSVEIDSGTTPNTVNQLFYQSYMIPSGWAEGIFLNASLSGTGLTVTQNDSANVTASGGGGANTLEIVNTTFGGGYLGLVSSIKATITDENGKKISGGLCEVSALSNDETRVLLNTIITPVNGVLDVSDILSPTRFNEGEDYSYRINCYCGSSGSSTECIDEDGNQINNSIGSAKNFFTTKIWITSNTVTDASFYNLKEEIFVCANVTNVDYASRIPLNIYYQIRCSKGTDINSDTDRIIIDFNEEFSPDTRGISSSTTQMQCMKFVIPEENYLMGSNSECYASTNVWVLDNSKEEILGYSTTSSLFNISSSELNLQGDWQWISDNTINSVINLSNYSDISGTGTGNIDVRVDFPNDAGVELHHDISSLNLIENITIYNSTGVLTEHTDYEFEILEDGYLEIEIRNVDLSSGWWNITLGFYDTELRQTLALEGIENKTGTFHLDVDCPSQGLIGSNLNCSITAQIEDPSLIQKEVDFTCYAYDGTFRYSELNFNQMVTKTPITFYREFLVPPSFENGQSYVLQCHADYYNLGSRRDSFYDTFVAVSSFGSSNTGSSSGGTSEGGLITGDAVAGLPEDEDESGGIFKRGDGPLGLDEESFSSLIKILSVIAVLVLFFILANGSRIALGSHKKFFKIVGISLLVVLVIGVLAYGGFFLSGKTGASVGLIKDKLVRGMILTLFISALIVALSKLLNVRGEIKFGEDPHYRRLERQRKINEGNAHRWMKGTKR